MPERKSALLQDAVSLLGAVEGLQAVPQDAVSLDGRAHRGRDTRWRLSGNGQYHSGDEVSARSRSLRGRDTSKAGRVRNVLTPKRKMLDVIEPPGGNLLSCNAAGSTNPCTGTEDSPLSTQCDAQSFETLVAAHTRSRRGGASPTPGPEGRTEVETHGGPSGGQGVRQSRESRTRPLLHHQGGSLQGQTGHA